MKRWDLRFGYIDGNRVLGEWQGSVLGDTKEEALLYAVSLYENMFGGMPKAILYYTANDITEECYA